MIEKRTDNSTFSLRKSAMSKHKILINLAKTPCEALDIKQPIGQNSQLHSFTASQLHSFTASQLRGSCAQINLNINYSNHAQRKAVSQRLTVCPRAFFIHRLIKPQRTPRTQRNIKECLTKPLLKHLCEVELCSTLGVLRG